ncbi:hypothetical protein F5B20DRAFT_584985 [Whalleya microplaca]|nr:hypothetical protein F5B20DRAFT_584985 [Whalleya microplaca]
MKSVIYSALLAALSGLANAVIITNSNFDGIEAGQPFEITWDEATGPVTLTLKSGAANNLNTVAQITTGATGSSFTWTPATSLASGQYAFEISDGTNVNYSQQFPISGGSASGSSSAVSATSASYTASLSSAVSATGSSYSTATISSSAASASSSAATSSGSSAATTGSSSSPATSSGTSSGSSAATSSGASTTRSSSASRTSSATSSQTSLPNANGAQSAVVPFVAPVLAVVGAVLL